LCVCADGSSSRGNRAAAAAATKRSAAAAAGAVGLSFEKMQLVRQKKEEIEKVGVMLQDAQLSVLLTVQCVQNHCLDLDK